MPKQKKNTTSKCKSTKNDSYIICPVSEEKIWISNVTLADMKKAARTGECPHSNKKKILVRIPSKAERLKRYEEAERALEAKEEAALPTYGGRSWKVTVTLKDPKSGKGKNPLFRWFRGNLELACLPHLLEKIPDPPKQRGITMLEEEEEEVRATALSERVASTLSVAAWNDREYAVPTVTTKWMSPNHVFFYSRKAAWENSEELVKQQIFLDKIIRGYGARGQELRPFKPTKAQALLAGKQRFLRDGLWVVGQEESWQDERSKNLEKIQKEEQRKAILLQKAGSAVQNLETADEQMADFQWNGSKPSDGVCQPSKPTGRRKMSPMQYFIRCNRELFRERKVAEKKILYGQDKPSSSDEVISSTDIQTVQAKSTPPQPQSNEGAHSDIESKVAKDDAKKTLVCDPPFSKAPPNCTATILAKDDTKKTLMCDSPSSKTLPNSTAVMPVSGSSASSKLCKKESKIAATSSDPVSALTMTSDNKERDVERGTISTKQDANIQLYHKQLQSHFMQHFQWHRGQQRPIQNYISVPYGPYVGQPAKNTPFAPHPQYKALHIPTPSEMIPIHVTPHHRVLPSNGIQRRPFVMPPHGGPTVFPPHMASTNHEFGGVAPTSTESTQSVGKPTEKCEPPGKEVIPVAAANEEAPNTACIQGSAKELPRPVKIVKTSETPSSDPDKLAKINETPSSDPDKLAKISETPSSDPDEIAKKNETPSSDPDKVAKISKIPSKEPDRSPKTNEVPSFKSDEIAKSKPVAKPTVKKIRQKTYTLSDADKDLKTVWRALSDEERNQWGERARSYEEKVKVKEAKIEKDEANNSTENGNSTSSSITSKVTPKVAEEEKVETDVDLSGQKRRDPSPTSVACNVEKPSNGTKDCITKTCSPLAPIVQYKTKEKNKGSRDSEVSKKLVQDPSLRAPRRITPSFHWRLKPEYIALCNDAVMDHYHKVMYTVKARGLYQELSDGFDVFRERGRGRYDMELPIFDSPSFDFLTDPEKATWIPVVKKILGDDAILIHKGAFLSMPGAEMQVYHQDGPHLTTKYHRPCHAVNVFIPLVDLHSRNGPTEFCLGSHILGNEDFVREQLFTPEVPAGTPVIFDYRLGHRGMGNTSSLCRPIIYCTYAASSNGKEFRDSINFSRRRYQKLGDLLDLPLSREERAKKRQRS